MSDLPKGWHVSDLGNIVRFRSGATRPSDLSPVPLADRCYPVYGGNGVLGYTALSNVKSRHIVIGRVGEKCGCVHLAEPPCWITDNALYSAEWLVTDMTADFLAYQLVWMELNRLRRKSGQPLITQGTINPLLIYVPPLAQQRAIAATLRAVQETRDARRRELAAERERKSALMEDLFTGGVRGEVQKDTEIGPLPQGWMIVSLGKCIANGPQNGLYKPASHYGKGTPILRIDAFTFGDTIQDQSLKRLHLSTAEVKNYRLSEGDIVINRVNGNPDLVGKCAVVGTLPEDIVFESNMMRFALNKALLLPRYTVLCLSSVRMREQIRQKARIINQASINQQDVSSLLVPVPPLDEQKDIAAVLTACDSKIAALEAETTLHDELFRALLDELLSGRVSTRPLIEDEKE